MIGISSPSALARLVLLVACLTLAFLNWQQINGWMIHTYAPGDGSPTAAAVIQYRPAERDTTSTQPAGVEPKQTYAVISERILFHPSRRPIPVTLGILPNAPTPTTPVSTSELQQYTLTGVVHDGDKRIAILKHASLPDSVRVIVGTRLHGWEVADIGYDQVSFRSGTSEFVIKFPKAMSDLPRQSAPSTQRREGPPAVPRRHR